MHKLNKIASTPSSRNPHDFIEDNKSWLVNDTWIAHQLQMTPGTIRGQRHKRKHGQPHWFDLDPVLIGSKPRYVRLEVEGWLKEKESNSKGNIGLAQCNDGGLHHV